MVSTGMPWAQPLPIEVSIANRHSLSRVAVPVVADRTLDMSAADHVTAYHGLARHWASTGRLSEAIAHQRKAVQLAAHGINSSFDVASEHVYLGQLLLRQETADTVSTGYTEVQEADSTSEAEAMLRTAISLAPSHPNAHETLLCCEFDRELRRVWTGREALQPSSLRQVHTALQQVLQRAEQRRLVAPALCGGDFDAPTASMVMSARFRAASNRVWQDAGRQCCAWLQDAPMLLEIRRALATGHSSSIREALPMELAAGVRRELLDLTWACSDDGGVQPLAYGAFMMRRCMPVVSEEQLAANKSTSLGVALSLLKGNAMKKLVTQLTGLKIDGVTIAQPTLLRFGDFLSIHNDAEGQRAVAFAWHLFDEWSPGDGGELAFVCPESSTQGQFVPPVANTLTLFRTQGAGFLGTHAVLPVLRQGGRRVAITGWFTTRSEPT